MSLDPARYDADTLERHRDSIRRVARGLVRDYDRTEDVAQETALRALSGEVRPRKNVGACLAGVARNVACRLLRREAARPRVESAAARDEPQPSVLDALARLDEQRLVLDAVRKLPDPYRSAVLLRYIDGLPPRAIARRLGCPVETVKSHLKRGLARLRETLDARHHGNRRAWLAVMLPLADWGPLASLSTSFGGVMAQETTRKFALSTLALLLLAGGATWGGYALFGADTPSKNGAAPLTSDLTGGAASDAEPAPTLSRRDGAGDIDTSTGAATSPGAQTGAGAAGGDTSATGAAASSGDEESAPPLKRFAYVPPVRRAPFSLPSGDQGGGGMGATGHWLKFGRGAPPKGDATLVVTVRDEEGLPLANALVLIGLRDIIGTTGVSFGDLRRLGRTDENGVVRAEALTGGEVALGADWHGLFSPQGFDARHAVPVAIPHRGEHAVTLTLPVRRKQMATVKGVVRDTEGAPIFSATAFLGTLQAGTRRDGSYTITGPVEGAFELRFSSWEHATKTVDVKVEPGGVVTQDVTLEHKNAGEITLSGVIVGPEGETVPHATVYIGIDSTHSTLRTIKADEEGRFVFEKLPERVTKESITIIGDGWQQGYSQKRATYAEGLPDGSDVRVQLIYGYTKVVIDVRDADTDDPVERVDLTLERPDPTDYQRGHLFYDPRMRKLRGTLAPGSYHVVLDALHHASTEFDLDVPRQKEYTHVVKLARVSPDSIDIALNLIARESGTKKPVTRCKIVVSDVVGDRALSRLEQPRADGRYRLPVPSGRRRVQVTAEGYAPYDEIVDFDPLEIEKDLVVELVPR